MCRPVSPHARTLSSGALLLVVLLSASAAADVPAVVSDIPPVHSLVSAVMDGIGTPAMLYRPDDSPHGSTLRPSAAARLQSADLVVWIGGALTPPLGRMIDSLEPDITSLALLDDPQTRRLPARHAHGDDRSDDHGVTDDPVHGVDAHAWLDPDNAIGWTRTIARTLATLDADHATGYANNATRMIERIEAATLELERALSPLRAQPFLVAHDSLQYLERRFGLVNGDSIAFGDAAAPGPATLDSARQRLLTGEVGCVLAETGEDSRYVRLVTDGTRARIGTIDPRGIALDPGAALYATLLTQLGAGISDCLVY